MADPAQAQAGADGTGGLDTAQDSPFRNFFPEAVQQNAKTVSYIRSTTLSIAGGVSGVLGLTNLNGFYFYLFSQLLVSLCILLLNAHSQPSKYLLEPAVLQAKGKNARIRKAVEAASSNSKSKSATTTAADAESGPGAQAWMWTKLILLDGAQDNLLSYILWWTFWYGLVHVYD